MMTEFDMAMLIEQFDNVLIEFAEKHRLPPHEMIQLQLMLIMNYFESGLETAKNNQDALLHTKVNKNLTGFMQELNNIRTEYHDTVIPPNTDKSKWH